MGCPANDSRFGDERLVNKINGHAMSFRFKGVQTGGQYQAESVHPAHPSHSRSGRDAWLGPLSLLWRSAAVCCRSYRRGCGWLVGWLVTINICGKVVYLPGWLIGASSTVDAAQIGNCPRKFWGFYAVTRTQSEPETRVADPHEQWLKSLTNGGEHARMVLVGVVLSPLCRTAR